MRSDFFSPSSEPGFYLPFYAPCAAVHPALSNCTSVPLDRFFTVFKWMLPIYGALHFVPAVLFKRRSFMQDPGKVIVKAGLGSLRSSAFLGVFVIIYQSMLCSSFVSLLTPHEPNAETHQLCSVPNTTSMDTSPS